MNNKIKNQYFGGVKLNQKKYSFLTIQQFIFLIYFVITTSIFILAIKSGNEGITLKIFGGGDDGYFYWTQAQNVAAGNPWIRTSIYPLILGNLMKITGFHNVYLIRIFNYFGFLLLVLLSMKLIKVQFKTFEVKIDSKYIYNSRILLLIGFLFYASLQMNVNLSIYRDIWIYTLYTLCTYLSIKVMFLKKNRFINIIGLILSLWLLGEFRKYALLSFLLAIGIGFVYKKSKMIKKPKRFIVFLILSFIAYYTFFMDLTILNMSLRRALGYRSSSLIAYSSGSQMWIKLDQPNVILFLINYIHSYIGNLIGPLPWHIKGISTFIVFIVETIPMCLILKFLWKKRSLISKVQKYILLHAFIWTSLIAVTNDNIGTASRLRPVSWILILIVFVVVYSTSKT